MAKKISSIKLGFFIFIGISIVVLFLFLIGDKNSMFNSHFLVRAYFSDIQGLRSGATVRLSGIDVGNVSSIDFVGDTARVVVSLNLLNDIRKFIRTDTQASIETEGLVGNKVVVLVMGTSGEQVKEGGTIKSKEPVGFAQIIGETQGIMNYTKEMTRSLAEIVAKVNKGEGTIGKILYDDKLYNQAVQLTQSADSSLKGITREVNNVTTLFTKLSTGVESVVNNVDSVIGNVDGMITDMKKGKGVLGALLVDGSNYDSLFSSMVTNIQKTTEDARLAASRLAENMEALKHNWLFKSYFEERGYWQTAKYEDAIDLRIKELDDKIKTLDGKMQQLRDLERTTSSNNQK